MKKFTLTKLLEVIEKNIASWYNIVLVRDDGVTLTFRCMSADPGYNSGSIRVRRDVPGVGPAEVTFEIGVYSENGKYHIDKSWRNDVEFVMCVGLDAPCWNVHPDTIESIQAMRDTVDKMEKLWSRYKED